MAEVFEAAKRNDLEKVKMFIDKGGVSPTIRSNERETLVHVAIKKGYLDMVKYLMEKDSSFLTLGYYPSLDPMGYAQGPCTLLEIAIEHGQIEIVKYLVEKQHADIYQVFHYSLTAVNWAVNRGNLNITKYFIEERNVDVNKPLGKYLSQPILFDAVENKRWDIIKYLIEERKADLTVRESYRNENILFAAVRIGNLEFIKYILDERKATFDINEKNSEGYTLVHVTTINDAVPSTIPNPKEILQYLIGEKHADFNIAGGKEQKTPLHFAVKIRMGLSAEKKSLEVTKYLIECGADVRKQDMNGDTALHLAISNFWGSGLEICKYLCEHNANVNQKNKKGETPLGILISKLSQGNAGHDTVEGCKILLNHGANVNETDNNGNSLVHIAAMKNVMNLLEYLVCDRKVNVNIPREADNWTPLHCAAFWNHFVICKYLIENGADIQAKGKCGKTPAQVASNQKLIDYIGNLSTTGRNRRSLENYLPSFLHSPTLHKITYPGIAGPSNQKAISFMGNDLKFGLLDSFSHISLLMRCFTKSAQQPINGSIAAILRDKIDPVAESAVCNLDV